MLSSRRATLERLVQAVHQWKALDEDLEKLSTESIKETRTTNAFLQTELRSYVKNTRAISRLLWSSGQGEENRAPRSSGEICE